MEAIEVLQAIYQNEIVIVEGPPLEIRIRVPVEKLLVVLLFQLKSSSIKIEDIELSIESSNISKDNEQRLLTFLKKQTSSEDENYFYFIVEKCRDWMSQSESDLEKDMTLENSSENEIPLPLPLHEMTLLEKDQKISTEYRAPNKNPNETFYQQEQREEMESLQSKFKSFQKIKHPDLNVFSISIAPTSQEHLNKIKATVTYFLTPQYPHDWPEISISIISNLVSNSTFTTSLARFNVQRLSLGLKKYLNNLAQKHHGRRQTSGLIDSAKKWLQDQNNYLLLEIGAIDALPEKPPIPQIIVDLLAFEFDNKMKLLNLASGSLIGCSSYTGGWDYRKYELTRCIYYTCYDDPEFILKLAFYVRNKLYIRDMANYLIALASNIKICQPYVREYFCSVVILPTDILSVINFYMALPVDSRSLPFYSLPNCLREGMKEKFKEFDEYSLGKYCSESHRKRLLKPPRKPEKQLTIKTLIRRLHISEPREYVMKILGVKYPSTEEEFQKSRLPGEWNPEKSGKRMKLSAPMTWEVLLSQRGNTSSAWEYLIETKKIPFLALIRNLRNIFISGVSMKHHHMVIQILTDQSRITSSKILPTQILSAYEATNINLSKLGKFKKWIEQRTKKEKVQSKRDKDLQRRGVITAEDLKKNEAKRLKSLKNLAKAHFGIRQNVLPRVIPTKALIGEYKNALDILIKVSMNHNLEKIPGYSIILCDVGLSMTFPCSQSMYQGKPRQGYEVSIMLGLILQFACENCDLYLFANEVVKTKKEDMPLPARVHHLVRETRTKMGLSESNFPFSVLDKCMDQRKHVSNVIVVSSMMIKAFNLQRKDFMNPLTEQLKTMRKKSNPDFFFFGIDLYGSGQSIIDMKEEKDDKSEIISGFSSQIVHYISTKNQTQIDHLESLSPKKKK